MSIVGSARLERWLAGLALLAAGVELQAATLRVGPQQDFPTITAALQEARLGDRLEVAAGIYRESIVIDKSVQVVGLGWPVIEGPGSGDVVQILSDEVTLTGFRIQGSGSRMMYSDAGVSISGKRVQVAGNELRDNLFGVYLKGCTQALVENNTIEGRRQDELGQRGAGVHFFDAHNNVVRKNRIHFVRDGVYFDHSDFNRVEDNEFSNLRYGVHYMYCKDNSFYRNVFRDSLAGVAVMYTERVVFRDNQILNNRKGHNSFGLLLKDCLDSVAERNVIVNNVNGVFLDNSHRNRFEKNLIAYNDVGVVLYASSLHNQFSRNDFVENLSVLRTVGRADASWTVEGLGNYYSEYTGYDLDSDGVGDIEHRLQDAFEYLEGARPTLRLFLNSAAAHALALAERSFPLIPSSNERDGAPRMRPVSGVRLTFDYGSNGAQQASSALILGPLAALALSGWLFWGLRR